jgi:hypothetical protein
MLPRLPRYVSTIVTREKDVSTLRFGVGAIAGSVGVSKSNETVVAVAVAVADAVEVQLKV